MVRPAVARPQLNEAMSTPPPPPEIREQPRLLQPERVRWLKVAAGFTLGAWVGLLWWARENPVDGRPGAER